MTTDLKLPGKPIRLNTIGDAKRIRAALWGSGGAGKTRFLMSAPRPLCYLGFDRPLEPGAWEGQGFDTEDVYAYDFTSRREGATIIVDDVRRTIREFAAYSEGTLAIDNGKVMWDVVVEALKDSNLKKGALGYGDANAFMRQDVFSMAGGNPGGVPSRLNFIITYPATDEWVLTEDENGRKSRGPSGKYIPHWWGHTEYGVDMVLWLYRWPTLKEMAVPPTVPDAAKARQSVSYWARPSKFLHVPDLVGSDIENPSFDRIWFECYGEHAGQGAWTPKK